MDKGTPTVSEKSRNLQHQWHIGKIARKMAATLSMRKKRIFPQLFQKS
jgi:hypothetical protein